MWTYEKKLECPVKIKTPNARYARMIIEQLGGTDGETGAVTRYLNQRFTMPYREAKAIMTDVGVSVSVLYLLQK